MSFNNESLVTIDADLNIINTVKTNEKYQTLNGAIDLNSNGNKELIVFAENKILIYSEKLEELAQFPYNGQLSYRYNGKGKNIDICISGRENFQILSYQENVFRNWAIYLSPVLALLIFGLLLATHKFTISTNIYVRYFLYSLRESFSGIILLDNQGKIRYFNGRIQNMLRFNPPLTKKMKYTEPLEKYPLISGYLTECLNENQPIRTELSFKENNIKFNGRLSVIPFKMPFGFNAAYLLELQNITETVQIDRQRVWSRTVQKMAHDIKTPLASVKLNLETIRLKLSDHNTGVMKKVDSDFQLISNELDRIREMTSQFLKFSNLEKPNFRVINFKEIINNVRMHFQSYLNHCIHLDIQFKDKIENMMADANQLEMLFRIFIENAIDAIAGKGRILVEISLEDILEKPGAKQIVIIIADSGKGILQEQRSKLFEPYYTTKSEGTGMGLAIAEKIVHDHSGKIELTSRPGFGAVFQIFLPYNT